MDFDCERSAEPVRDAVTLISAGFIIPDSLRKAIRNQRWLKVIKDTGVRAEG